jgi:uncharacterized protein YndB with AHSA1/START domain
MSLNLIAKSTVTINAPASKVWEALTKPELIKKYFFGTETVSEWRTGSPIEFHGEWEGKRYLDKGIILQILPDKLLQYTYFSSFSGLEDKPENYMNITYELDEEEAGLTTVTVRQENIQDIRTKEHSEENWSVVLQNLKELVENNFTSVPTN